MKLEYFGNAIIVAQNIKNHDHSFIFKYNVFLRKSTHWATFCSRFNAYQFV